MPPSKKRKTRLDPNHLIVRNGEVIGGWRRLVEKKRLIVETRLLVALSRPERDALQAAAAQLGRFAGQPAAVVAAGKGAETIQ